ncbi:MAG TPA: copper oxidase [Thermoanaerobaculia bacterium]|nr:copper oxidase [Thermoanaerobaculia bacterium]
MKPRFSHPTSWIVGLLLAAAVLAFPGDAQAQTCARTLTADVVALDQVFFWNRLGAVQPQGMVFALRRDVVATNGSATLSTGNVQLRAGKRPRPLVLRMNVGDCLRIQFQNLLASTRVDQEQPATRDASIHAVGMQLVDSIADDGSFVGANASSLVPPGGSAVYTLYGGREGEHLLYSAGTTTGGQGDGGQINAGLFGAVVVEPQGAFWYRSQVSEEDLRYATTGTTATTGHPIINYDAVYPAGHDRAGLPILKILHNGEIIHSDLTAIIAGSSANGGGLFPYNRFPANAMYPRRDHPFREFVTIYHDEIGAVQAFPQFEQDALAHTLHSGRDGFAINYGTGGVGAEVLANRLGVGPMWNCPECKYEEFFLTSWVVGDPAMVVDVPANSPCTVSQLRDGTNCTPTPGRKATKAFYPDDPSNVYHSYLRDHTRFRVLHAGSKEHHIHHLHAHQWLYTPDDDESSYLDSQALGPGSGFTAEIAYDGSGNLNQTMGDSIFHCHFYPHFAQGMWALWRVHDVFEKGTPLGTDGRPAANSRALPDGEIAAGTPIPAIVPVPGRPMAPLPGAAVAVVDGQVAVTGTGNPGFPFFVPAKAGNRPPKPPLDTIDDGGLPRHRIDRSFASTFAEAHTRHDFHKELLTTRVEALPEDGTAVEKAAMAFHAQREHSTCQPNGSCDGVSGAIYKFIANGRPAVAGAPFADPCIDPAGLGTGNRRVYKGAAIETDVTFNKAGWHFPQQRFFALWEDVDDFLTPNGKPPEPLFFRANSKDCIEYHFTNLVPHEYQLDDFQVRTPTDILGQHIHLVKFDVMASDGAANGFNYEDGSFSPGEVQERVAAIRAGNSCAANDARNGTLACPVAEAHPFFGAGPNNEWLGAQTTVQRWYADPIKNNAGVDRTLRTVFTHDHFGPSTHQQAGLYAGLVIEPQGSTWKHNETGATLGGRPDGGPTSWQAIIDPPTEPDYREFLLAFHDFQPAYPEEATAFPSPALAINPPAKKEVDLSVSNDLLERPDVCPGGGAPPCPELVSADDIGTMTVNYRNEPVALRVYDPATDAQATGWEGDLAMVFSSNVTRKDARLNVQPSFYQALTNDLLARDPYTPLLRAYENDRVQIRVLVGGHEEGHNFSIHGIKWLQEPSNPDSGYRNSQMMGISEHFEFIVPQLVKQPSGSAVDRLWSAGSSADDYWNGLWGLFRAYTGKRPDLAALPDNVNGQFPIDPAAAGHFDFSCPKDAPERVFNVVAIESKRSLMNYNQKIVYNSRTENGFDPLFEPSAMMYVRAEDIEPGSTNYSVKPGMRLEPLVLRARAGECIVVNLSNRMDYFSRMDGFSTLPMLIDGFNANDIQPSSFVGLHPQMLYYDVSRYDGIPVGNNGAATSQMARKGESVTYRWYAGDVKVNANGTVTATPIEFGATNLISPDRILHAGKGGIGALIIEPADATWTEDANHRAAATVTSPTSGTFREFVLQFQNDVNLRTGELTTHNFGTPVPKLAGLEDPEDTGHKAVNYRTEPLWKRRGHAADTPFEQTDDFTDWAGVVSNGQVGGDPETPIFTAAPGQAVRFRLLQAGGHSRNSVFALHGHIWDKQPYVNGSAKLGHNAFSLWEGARMGHGPTNHADLLLRNGAGGKFGVPGDYLYRDFVSTGFDGGVWGILRVAP